MIEQLLWQVSQDGVTWTDMPSPSSYSYQVVSVDDDSYRSVITANIIRKRIAKDFHKFSLEYKFLSHSQCAAIRAAVTTRDKFYFRGKSPMVGNVVNPNTGETSWIKFKAYCGDLEGELLDVQMGWTLKFSVIQSDRESFND